VFWKAAAIFVFFTTAWAFAYVLKKPVGTITNTLELVDTVYVKKEAMTGPEKIHDTVFIYKTKEDKPGKQTSDSVMMAKEVMPLENTDELDVLPVSEFGNEMNGPKNNSRKDDSLSKNYKLIAL
jgi:hypothetical protein